MGSDSANKLFLTILYEIYFGINLDYGSIMSAQIVQSTLSSIRHIEILCARFWCIIVQRAIDRHNIPVKFSFIGSLLEAMVNYVSTSNELISEYRKIPASGLRPLTPEMQKALEEANKPKKDGK